MMMEIHVCGLAILIWYAAAVRYEPNWKSLDSRPLPAWYDEAKFGVFMHWGVFSVPSYGGKEKHSISFWEDWATAPADSEVRRYINKNYKDSFTYADFAAIFTAELYDPDHWADILQASGARYTVLTTKHHEGFCNWGTNVSFNWNSMDVGPRRDLIGDFVTSIRRRTDLHLGLYHNLFEPWNPLYRHDKRNHFKTQIYSLTKTIPELYELVNSYQPELVWSDGEFEAPDKYWNSTEFLTWLYNDSPVKDFVVTNDRWGAHLQCKHGGYLTCGDKFNPKVLQKRKWENAMSLDTYSWGYRRDALLSEYYSVKDLITLLAQTISCGGNLLLNVGPTHDGRIIPLFEERLRGMGDWLKINGEAVYGSSPWSHQNDSTTPGIWYTQRKSNTSANGYSVYAFVLDWPDTFQLELFSPVSSQETLITMLGYSKPLTFRQYEKSINITMPIIAPGRMPSNDAWVIKFDNLN